MVYYTLWETGETACERECLSKFYLYTTENLVLKMFHSCSCVIASRLRFLPLQNQLKCQLFHVSKSRQRMQPRVFGGRL